MEHAGRPPRQSRARAHRGPGRRDELPYALFRAAEGVVGRIPHRLAYRIGAILGDAVMLAQPGRFRGLRQNLSRVMPAADDRSLRKVAHANVRNLARSWIDVLEMRSRPQSLVDRLYTVDYHHLAEAIATGRGVIVISLHLGAWEAGLAGFNRSGMGRMALLAEILDPPRLFQRVNENRANMGVKVIPIDVATIRGSDPQTARMVGATALREVVRHLRSGGVIAIAIDRDLVGNGEPLPFFDASAPIPTGVVDIAIRSGAALVPVFLIRDGLRVRGLVRPQVAYDPSAPRREEILRVTGELVGILEGVIRKHPDQWHVLDPIWPDGGTWAATS